MKRSALALLFILMSAPTVSAQTIHWQRDFERAINTARREHKPLLCYLVDNQHNRGIPREHFDVWTRKAVRDAAAWYVPVEVAIDKHPELRERWELKGSGHHAVVIATPDGERLLAGRVGNERNFLSLMRRGLEQFGEHLWTTELRASLQPDTAHDQLTRSLNAVENLKLLAAESKLIALLDSSHASSHHARVARLLATFSTRRSMSALVDRLDNRHVRAALSRVSPVGAEILAESLNRVAPRRFSALYEAVCKSCKTSPKPAAWWKRADRTARDRELTRVRSIARKAAWRERLRD